MASDATGSASLTDEEEMATYYMMETDYDQQPPNGISRYNMQKGYPIAGSSQSIRK